MCNSVQQGFNLAPLTPKSTFLQAGFKFHATPRLINTRTPKVFFNHGPHPQNLHCHVCFKASNQSDLFAQWSLAAYLTSDGDLKTCNEIMTVERLPKEFRLDADGKRARFQQDSLIGGVKLILQNTRIGDTVGDLCCGSGTLAAASALTCRNSISVDCDELMRRIVYRYVEEVEEVIPSNKRSYKTIASREVAVHSQMTTEQFGALVKNEKEAVADSGLSKAAKKRLMEFMPRAAEDDEEDDDVLILSQAPPKKLKTDDTTPTA